MIKVMKCFHVMMILVQKCGVRRCLLQSLMYLVVTHICQRLHSPTIECLERYHHQAAEQSQPLRGTMSANGQWHNSRWHLALIFFAVRRCLQSLIYLVVTYIYQLTSHWIPAHISRDMIKQSNPIHYIRNFDGCPILSQANDLGLDKRKIRFGH